MISAGAKGQSKIRNEVRATTITIWNYFRRVVGQCLITSLTFTPSCKE